QDDCMIWELIFKKDNWLEEVLKIRYSTPCYGDPIPILLGKDMRMIARSEASVINVALLVNDWGGDCQFLKKLFLSCLQDGWSYEDKSKSIIVFKHCHIRLQAEEVLRGQEVICITQPEALIGSQEGSHYTCVSYYDGAPIQTIDESSI
ncbi:hypothetical protein B0J15DRAFT_380234, partial [Fusarium solani]